MLMSSIADMFYAFGTVFFVCELGQRVSDAFETYEDTIIAFDWYAFPIELQQMLLISLQNAQQEVEIECFGSISGNRETFKKVFFHFYLSNSSTVEHPPIHHLSSIVFPHIIF